MAQRVDGHTNGHLEIPTINATIKSIYTASSVEEIHASLAELSQREAKITSRLDALLATQKDLARSLSRLDLARAHLGTQAVAARQISNGMLSSASASAARMSGAVKKLDQEQAAVRSTLDVVEQVAELKACVLGVSGSMGAPQDWETAATYLDRASKIPREVVEGAFAEEMVPSAEVPDPPRITLDQASESLCGLFLREFERAARDGDGARVTRFFKLFPLIGKKDIGLDAYGRYVCSGIASRARSNTSNAAQRQQSTFYATALTKLFEHIAQIVDGHEPLVERHYGTGSMTKVIERIQIEADVQGGLILDTWADERRVNRKMTDIKSYPFNFLLQSFLSTSKPTLSTPRTGSPAPGVHGKGVAEDDSIDMKEIDSILNECAIMLGRWSLYTRFLSVKTSHAESNSALHLPPFLVHSTLSKKVNDMLVETFNILATFFFRRSVEKSFQMDEQPSDLTLNPNKQLGAEPPIITSAVDDVMYIVNQVLQRTLATNQKTVVSSVVPSVGRVLGGDFFGMMQRKMKDESYPKAAIQGALPPEGVIISFLVLMNNLDLATDYVRRIVFSSLGAPPQDNDESSLMNSFPFGNEAIFVEKALKNMEISFAVKTSELINEATEVMLKQVMRPRLRPVMMETFRDVDYTLNQEADEDEAGGEEDLVPKRFERGWNAFTLPIKRILTPTNYNLLISSTTLYLSRTLERRLWSFYGRITPLGAIKLERDISGIVAAAVKGNRYELRDLFARCLQMCTIINMEEDEWEEISKLNGLELERISGVEWKLDEGERKRTRGLLVGVGEVGGLRP